VIGRWPPGESLGERVARRSGAPEAGRDRAQPGLQTCTGASSWSKRLDAGCAPPDTAACGTSSSWSTKRPPTAVRLIRPNPRRAVEHTVTEQVTVSTWCRRRSRLPPAAAGALELDPRHPPAARGFGSSAGAGRDVDESGQARPSTGTLSRCDLAQGPGVARDTQAQQGASPSPHFDTLFASSSSATPAATSMTCCGAPRALGECRLEGLAPTCALRALAADESVRQQPRAHAVDRGAVPRLRDRLADFATMHRLLRAHPIPTRSGGRPRATPLADDQFVVRAQMAGRVVQFSVQTAMHCRRRRGDGARGDEEQHGLPVPTAARVQPCSSRPANSSSRVRRCCCCAASMPMPVWRPSTRPLRRPPSAPTCGPRSTARRPRSMRPGPRHGASPRGAAAAAHARTSPTCATTARSSSTAPSPSRRSRAAVATTTWCATRRPTAWSRDRHGQCGAVRTRAFALRGDGLRLHGAGRHAGLAQPPQEGSSARPRAQAETADGLVRRGRRRTSGDVDMPIIAGLNNHTFSQFAALSGQVPVIGVVHGRASPAMRRCSAAPTWSSRLRPATSAWAGRR